MSRPRIFFFTILCVIALFSNVVLAAGSSVSGVVVDTKGASISGATVTLVAPEVQAKSVSTDQQGRFKFDDVAPGIYVVTVSAKGFAELRRDSVNVIDGKAATLELKLEPASVQAELNVNVSGLK